jgi:dihydroorotate dehydrogenase
MGDTAVHYRNRITHSIYRYIFKPIFFRIDPEYVHDNITRIGSFLGRYKVGKKVTRAFFGYHNPILEQDISGLHFTNPVGLSAGFDKNGQLLNILPEVGFGFAEIGSVTGNACPGNPKPRLWRLKKSRSLVVYYGLKNDGCDVIAERLKDGQHQIPFGMSVAMTNCAANTDIDAAIADYAKAFRVMEPVADYVTVNISCPNTLGGQPFVLPENLTRLFAVLDRIPTHKPIFIKLSPDMTMQELDALLDCVRGHRVHGIICTNLTKKRDNARIIDPAVPEKGGMSGKVVEGLSDMALSHMYKREGKKFLLIGSGGIFTAEDAYRKIRLGASLVQMITGMIFEGPQIVSDINHDLARLLKRDGFTHISQAIGIDNIT